MTEVVIIGSGVVGATIAYELSQNPQLKIVLIDEQTPASGSTGAALGILMGVISHKTKGRGWRLRQTSIERYETLIPELEALTGTKIPCNRQGIVMLRFEEQDEEKWRNLSKIRANQGYRLEMWDVSQLQAKCPHVAHHQVVGAIYSPQDQQVNPAILTKALVAGAAQRGVDCKFGLKVHNLVSTDLNGSNNRHCYQIQTTGEDIEADWVILAAGIGSSALAASLSQTVTISPVLGQALLLKHHGVIGEPHFQPVITGNDVHIAPIGGGEYWVGATVEFPEHQGERLAGDEELLDKVRQQAIAFCPSLAEATIMLSWSGNRPRPEGQPAPVIGKLPGYDNVILATGHYRNGVLLAPATAKIVYETIAELALL
jgi:glycine/D-amino acid oxidase-like deaminating enzyme